MSQVEDLQSWLMHIDSRLSDLHLSDKSSFERLEVKIDEKVSKTHLREEILRLSTRMDKLETSVSLINKQVYIFIGIVLTAQVVIGWIIK